MKLALVLTALAVAVSSAAAMDCHCFYRCGQQSRHCYGQLQYKQRQCHNRCHNNWRCYHHCVDEWTDHCNKERRECLSHCDDHKSNRCYQEIMEPVNIVLEEIEDEGQQQEEPAASA